MIGQYECYVFVFTIDGEPRWTLASEFGPMSYAAAVKMARSHYGTERCTIRLCLPGGHMLTSRDGGATWAACPRDVPLRVYDLETPLVGGAQ